MLQRKRCWQIQDLTDSDGIVQDPEESWNPIVGGLLFGVYTLGDSTLDDQHQTASGCKHRFSSYVYGLGRMKGCLAQLLSSRILLNIRRSEWNSICHSSLWYCGRFLRMFMVSCFISLVNLLIVAWISSNTLVEHQVMSTLSFFVHASKPQSQFSVVS